MIPPHHNLCSADRVNEKELKQIAGEDTSRYRQVENFEGLNLELLLDLDLCIQSEEVHYMTVSHTYSTSSFIFYLICD